MKPGKWRDHITRLRGPPVEGGAGGYESHSQEKFGKHCSPLKLREKEEIRDQNYTTKQEMAPKMAIARSKKIDKYKSIENLNTKKLVSLNLQASTYIDIASS